MPDGLSPTKGYIDSLLEALVSVPKGILGIDPTPEEEKEYSIGPSINKGIQIGSALKGFGGATMAALPMAVPRSFQKSLIQDLKALQYGRFTRAPQGLSPDYDRLLTRWTGGEGMNSRSRNLDFAEWLRNSDPKDLEAVRDMIRQKLGTDTVPVFRGTRSNGLQTLRDYYNSGTDPGIRSMTMEPKATHFFADSSQPFPGHRFDLSRPPFSTSRPTSGQVFRGDVPIEKVLGFGGIDQQKELIIDMQGLDPDQYFKVLRDYTSMGSRGY